MRIATHLLFVLVVGVCWCWYACEATSIVENCVVVLGAAHLGAVAVVTWPKPR